MFINAPLPFINSFIDKVNKAIQEYNPDKCLTRIQKNWIKFCIMSVLMTNTVCWFNFAKTSMGKCSFAALSWMFRKSKIPWEILLVSSTRAVLRRHGITEGCLGIDDTDKKRSKSARKISNVHKIKDKTSGGYIMGQSLVFLLLITP
ncbi:hypothetical protein [Desulfobacula sp.]|uniref:hypothetical protein n=1 Tax=Desulfobacula sp. TaxID=2593537 RepID=UPI002609B019|nr:hypothetical protein [Desulfobacula sp.]